MKLAIKKIWTQNKLDSKTLITEKSFEKREKYTERYEKKTIYMQKNIVDLEKKL